MANAPKWTRGPVIPVHGEILPTIAFDFSHCLGDVPIEKWTRGPVIPVRGEILVLDPIDCSSWINEPMPKVALDLHPLRANDESPDGDEYSNLYDSLNGFDRAIGGAGWKLESTHRDNGTLTLTLAPVDPVGAAQRATKIVAAINQPGLFETPAALGKIEARIIEPGG